MDARMFPVIPQKDCKPGPLSVPWSVGEKAYSVYVSRYGRDQSMERLAERGGFWFSEMDMFHPTWREEASEVHALRKRLAEEQRNRQATEEARLAVERELADLRATYEALLARTGGGHAD